jgi:hypothetical protein
MTDQSLPEIWTSQNTDEPSVSSRAMSAVLEEDRTDRQREAGFRLLGLMVLAILCPVLIWAAAHGITPVVRGGYALMATGAAITVFAEWIYLSWSGQAEPRAVDAQSQLHATAVMLRRLAVLVRTAGLWCAPIFVGTVLIGIWMYHERSHAGGYLLWSIDVMAWTAVTAGSMFKAARLDQRRQRMEDLLADLREP